ncbi:transglycosylase SLT domain-containing protein [Streptomyces sp. MST-110588]|uniref:transglycosylase SLT domain-containing protein n=1 Tax=Streptomyces sp. MST-110588 TaxID=2833628 RepID=UPI001F5CC545|nr:transglycosylase SLT domain-containing protein [Streptomyces sp. MST-110588]UNO38529.1 transglycosylase SLT domain-containing protein [Streptomyces sp. MST-110588]
MPAPALLRSVRITKNHKISAAVVAAAGCAAALSLTAAPADAHAVADKAPSAIKPVSANGQPVGAKVKTVGADARTAGAQKKDFPSLADSVKVTAIAAQDRTAQEAANRSTDRKPVQAAPKAAQPAKPAPKQYANNLDGWIRQALDIMKANGIPGSYEGLHRNIMRESSGNPEAVNDWDVNAVNGIPSKGLLQVIQPTFEAYHVAGTANKLTDPVANITAAANYAADKYGSIDNVNSAY